MDSTLKRLFSILFFCGWMLCVWAQDKDYPIVVDGGMKFYQYTAKTSEGLYSVSRQFNVPLAEILRYNPSIGENGLKKGAIVLVPILEKETANYHTIEAKETLYSISKKYGITSEQLMAANPGISEQVFPIGRKIVIPEAGAPSVPQPVLVAPPAPTLASPALTSPPETVTVNPPVNKTVPGSIRVIKTTAYSKKTSYTVALLLPFTGKDVTPSNNRYIEYYEGFLLAVDSMKAKGLSLDLYVFDTGLLEQPVSRLLENNEIPGNTDLIIGGIDREEISRLSEFSKNLGIKYVIPFSAKHEDDWKNPNIFQVIPAQNIVQTRAANVYAANFRGKNVIFLNCTEDNGSKSEFIRILKNAMDKDQTPYFYVNYSEKLENEIKDQLVTDRENIILPTSSSSDALQNITASLRMLATSGNNITLYGYPGQLYAKELLLEDLFLLDAHFYSTFYANNTSPEIKSFYNKYKYWYHKSLLNTYPKYGLMGFDTGMYFLNALYKFGTVFEENLGSCTIPSLQTAFNFEQCYDDGSYTNVNLFMVEFTPDFILKKSIVR